MHRDRITLVALSLTLALGAAVSCTDSEPINNANQTGQAGATSSGAAGSTTGAAGSTTGAAGSTTGTAGSTTGTAGSTTGTAGSTTGAAGSTTGTAGSTTGTAGSTTGTAGAGGAGGGAAGAGGAGGAGGVAMLSFATDIYPFIKTQCTPCHIANSDGQLSMKDATTAYTNLVGTTMGVAAKTNLTCMMLDTTKKRVVVGDPMHSFLYIKVANTNAVLMPKGCQPSMPEMPQSTLTLTTAQVQMISDWITGGAKP